MSRLSRYLRSLQDYWEFCARCVHARYSPACDTMVCNLSQKHRHKEDVCTKWEPDVWCYTRWDGDRRRTR
jgi:hypothetical protein